MAEGFTHFDPGGASRMVDVSSKGETLRTARASGRVRMRPGTLVRILDRSLEKGDVVIVPAGTPHWFETVPGPLTYYVVKVR